MYKKNKLIFISLNDIKSFNKNQFHIFFKKMIFSGYIFILQSNPYISNIIRFVRNDISESFKKELFYNYNTKTKKESYLQKKLQDYQEEFKKNCFIKKNFSLFLNSIGLSTKNTFIDQICLRVSSPKKGQDFGILPRATAHRDTWSSNLSEQINWWFPIKSIIDTNSLYFVPEYFKRIIRNTSADWNYFKYKQNPDKFTSTPTIKDPGVIKNKKLIIRPRLGEIVCFSGHHLHGSNPGDSIRLNIETRSISLGDHTKFRIPKKIDYHGRGKKLKWFKGLESKNCLSLYYK